MAAPKLHALAMLHFATSRISDQHCAEERRAMESVDGQIAISFQDPVRRVLYFYYYYFFHFFFSRSLRILATGLEAGLQRCSLPRNQLLRTRPSSEPTPKSCLLARCEYASSHTTPQSHQDRTSQLPMHLHPLGLSAVSVITTAQKRWNAFYSSTNAARELDACSFRQQAPQPLAVKRRSASCTTSIPEALLMQNSLYPSK